MFSCNYFIKVSGKLLYRNSFSQKPMGASTSTDGIGYDRDRDLLYVWEHCNDLLVAHGSRPIAVYEGRVVSSASRLRDLRRRLPSEYYHATTGTIEDLAVDARAMIQARIREARFDSAHNSLSG